MGSTSKKAADKIVYLLKYIDCALLHPQPLPKGKHVYRSDLSTVPEIRDLYDCLYKVYSEESASVSFREPVDALDLGVFDYYTVVTEPMSIRTVLDRIAEGGHYSQASQVLNDVEKIWSNCEKFNGADSALAGAARKCKALLEKLLERLTDEHYASTAEAEKLVNILEDADESVLVAVEEYFRKEDPSLVSGGEVDLGSIKLKHVKAIKAIVDRLATGGSR